MRPEVIWAAKVGCDPAGHYRRKDLFEFRVHAGANPFAVDAALRRTSRNSRCSARHPAAACLS
jgi:hypothetical protein